MKRSIFLRAALYTLTLTALSHSAFADDYPARPVELLVPYAVGGGTDAVARAFADAASRQFPKPLIVVNRPGAAGAIGHLEGARRRLQVDHGHA